MESSDKKNEEDTKKRETEGEKKVSEVKMATKVHLNENKEKRLAKDSDDVLPESSVTSFEESLMFRCPELGDDVLSHRDWKIKFREQLAILKESDDVLAAILTIKSLNSSREAENCVVLLEKYMRNLIDYPDIDKYRCIRLGNQIFNERVLSVEGGLDFLMSIGFKTAISDSDNKEPYLVYNPNSQIDIESILKSLKGVTAFELELDRNIKIVHPKDVSENREDTTDEFYEWTLKEMKKEQKVREDEQEKRQVLRSRSKKNERMANRDYSYTRIRVKFPDGVLFEAVFSVKEKLSSLKSLLLSKFYFYDNFNFMALPSKVFNVLDEEKTFADLELLPKVTLMLKWEMNSTGDKYALKTS